MMRYAERYPKLHYFLGGYFHEDWVDSDSFEDVVADFQTEPAETVRQATRELEEFLRLDIPEKELRDILLYDLRSYVRAPGLGLTYRQWLEAVLAILKQPIPVERQSRPGAVAGERPRSRKR
jgi:hypothetical protein